MSRHNLNRTSRSSVPISNAMSQQKIEAELKLEVKNVAIIHNFVVTQNENLNDKCCDKEMNVAT